MSIISGVLGILNGIVIAEYRQIFDRKATKRRFSRHNLKLNKRSLILLQSIFWISMASKAISVLLVDDDVSFARVFQDSLLKARGIDFRVTRKTNVDEALATIKANPLFDIIVTDFVLPDLTGLEFCLRLSQMEQRIPVVMISSTKDIKLAVEVMKLGVEDFWVKDELHEAHVARTLVNILDRIKVKNQMRAVEKRMSIAENRAQAIRELVVTVCHEFNNPLAAIKISSDLLQRVPMPEHQQTLLREFDLNFQKIESEVRRLRDITFEKVDLEAVRNLG